MKKIQISIYGILVLGCLVNAETGLIRRLDNTGSTSKPINLTTEYSEELEGGVDDGWAYFNLNLEQQLGQAYNYKDSLTDLVVQVQQAGSKFTDPNLYINYVRKHFSLELGVYCDRECEFLLQAELVQELLFDPGRTYKLYFMANQERIMRFQIPDYSNITSVEIKGVNQNKFDRFNMIMTKGNQLPTSDNALYLRPAWENGYVGKFNDDCSCFCKGCNYTVLVSSETEGYITVGAKVTGQVIDLSTTDGEIYDSVLYHHQQCYSYMVNKADMDLRIKLESYSGDPNIYVNPLTHPINLGQSIFNSRDHFDNEELTLTPELRGQYNATSGLYYICIFGNTAATYKLTVKNQNHEVFLKVGLSESGYLDFNKTMVYYFRDNILAQEDAEIDFQLHVMTGIARLRTKLCEIKSNETYEDFKNNCTMTLEELLEDDPTEKISSHIGQDEFKTNTSACKLPNQRGAQVTCVYAIGVLGIANFRTHFSTMVKTNTKADYTVLKEGIPIKDEIKEVQSDYYMVSINDPNVTKISFQLTTIHGDPDIFISRKAKEPSQYNFEKRSIRCGIFPEIITYEKNINIEDYKTLEGDYYIAVFGYVQSTFSLVYYTETENDKVAKVKLLSGQKQKGVIKSTNESLMYYFKLSKEIKEDVEIRLHSENGHFKLYLGMNYHPNQTDFCYEGDEHNPIIFNQMSTEASTNITSYFVRVVPVSLNNSTTDTAGMAFVFTIAFYELGTFIQLSEGVALRGSVTNLTFDYYYFDVNNRSIAYEISLTSLSGNPDLVISLDADNKFPDKDSNNYISENSFSVDSIMIDASMIEAQENKSNKKVKSIFIGVYTNDPSSTYSILVTKKNMFTPILLQNGQIQQGSLDPNENKFYYFKTGSSQPLYASLAPKKGNPDFGIYFIKNLSMSMYQWESQTHAFTKYYSKESFGADIIYLSNTDPTFVQECGSSCILLIKVENANSESHYTIQVSRDIQELAENSQVDGVIGAFGQYQYYKFYKSCEKCDLEITLVPQQIHHNLVALIEHNVTNKLPTHQNYPRWSLNANELSTLTISHDDKAFQGKSSNGYYIIGIHAHQNSSFSLSVQTLTGNQKGNQTFNIRKIYKGESQDINFQAGQVKYFYYENWVNASLIFSYQACDPSQNQLSRMRQPLIDMQIAAVNKKRIPKTKKDIEQYKWATNKNNDYNYIQAQYSDKIFVNRFTENIEFCVQCFYVLRVQNVRQDKEIDIRIIVTQNDENGSGFTTNMMVGKPYFLQLTKTEKAQMYFSILNKDDEDYLMASLQYYNGKAKISFVDESLSGEIYPKNEFSKSRLSVIGKQSQVQIIFKQIKLNKRYKLVIEALTDLHASIILNTDENLSIIPEGLPINLVIENDKTIVQKFFTYVPPSNKFQLAISAVESSFNIPYKIYIKKISSSPLRQLQPANQNEGSLDFRPPDFGQIGMKPQDLTQFDHEIFSMNSHDKYNLFEVLPIEMNDDQDLLLIRVDIMKGNKRNAELSLTFSGSEILVLTPGQTVKGHVSNWNTTFRIYEIFINKANLYQNDTTDLYIEVTPCNGRVHFYVSDDYMALFSNNSHAGYLDLIYYSMFGKSTQRVKDIANKDVIYVGVESSNEFYTQFDKQIDSYFELKTQYIPGSQKDLMETYFFDKSSKEIELVVDEKDSDSIYVKWNSIYTQNGKTKEYKGVDDITYQLFIASNDTAKFSMNSICAIDHYDQFQQITSVFIKPEDMDRKKMKLNKSDLQNIKVISLFARVKDPNTGEIVNLAYEPYLISNEQYGIKIQTYQLVLVVVLAMIMLFFLGFIVYCLRRKSMKLDRRLQNQVKYVQQDYSIGDMSNDTNRVTN